MFYELGIQLPRSEKEETLDHAAGMRERVYEVLGEVLDGYGKQLRSVRLALDAQYEMDLVEAYVATIPGLVLWPWDVVAAFWSEERGPHLVLRTAVFADQHETPTANGQSGAELLLAELDREKHDVMRELDRRAAPVARVVGHVLNDAVEKARQELNLPSPRA